MAKKEEKASTEPRWLDHVLTLELPQPAFAGPGHTAVQIIAAAQLQRADPFVLLVDDRLDFISGQQVGGPHPHAGFETVTWMLAGMLADHDEGLLQTGDIGWMTAGRGVIHGEDVRTPAGPARLLQLWIRLPEKDRAVPPRVEVIRGADVRCSARRASRRWFTAGSRTASNHRLQTMCRSRWSIFGSTGMPPFSKTFRRRTTGWCCRSAASSPSAARRPRLPLARLVGSILGLAMHLPCSTFALKLKAREFCSSPVNVRTSLRFIVGPLSPDPLLLCCTCTTSTPPVASRASVNCDHRLRGGGGGTSSVIFASAAGAQATSSSTNARTCAGSRSRSA